SHQGRSTEAMKWHDGRQRRLAAWAGAAIALSAFACGKDAVVGGACRQGLAECSLKCTDLAQDPINCGACGHACASGQSCVAGSCGNAEASFDVAVDAEGTEASVTDSSQDPAVSDIGQDLGGSDISAIDVQRESGTTDGQGDISAIDGAS